MTTGKGLEAMPRAWSLHLVSLPLDDEEDDRVICFIGSRCFLFGLDASCFVPSLSMPRLRWTDYGPWILDLGLTLAELCG